MSDWKTKEWHFREPYNLLWFLEHVVKLPYNDIIDLVGKDCIAIDGYPIDQHQLLVEPKPIDDPDSVDVKVIVEFPENNIVPHMYNKQSLINAERERKLESQEETAN